MAFVRFPVRPPKILFTRARVLMVRSTLISSDSGLVLLSAPLVSRYEYVSFSRDSSIKQSVKGYFFLMAATKRKSAKDTVVSNGTFLIVTMELSA